MHLAVLCATQRGLLFLRELSRLSPKSRLTVFSFREEACEPPFLEDIRKWTEAHGGEFFESDRAGDAARRAFWESSSIDLMFIVSWRYRIPADVYGHARLGAFVFHDSLLPEYRGFSPTVWAIVNGEDHTGVTLFEIAEQIDAGPIVDQQRVDIGPDEYIGGVMERVTQAYLQVLGRNLDRLMQGTAPRRPQNHTAATWMKRRLAQDNRIDWMASSTKIYNLIRAVSRPYPGAYTHFQGRRIRIWSARPAPAASLRADGPPGRILERLPGKGALVRTGDGAIWIEKVQRDEDGVMSAEIALDAASGMLGT
jgi:methionyl-tRNA formyltransferase